MTKLAVQLNKETYLTSSNTVLVVTCNTTDHPDYNYGDDVLRQMIDHPWNKLYTTIEDWFVGDDGVQRTRPVFNLNAWLKAVVPNRTGIFTLRLKNTSGWGHVGGRSKNLELMLIDRDRPSD